MLDSNVFQERSPTLDDRKNSLHQVILGQKGIGCGISEVLVSAFNDKFDNNGIRWIHAERSG